MNNSNEEIVNGANPSIIWSQYMYFLCEYGKYMKSMYTKKMRTNTPVTWSELDNINKQIHDKLDYLMTWSDKFNQNSNTSQQISEKNTNESLSRNAKAHLSESQLHKIIKESVRKVLSEIKIVGKIDDFNPNQSYYKPTVQSTSSIKHERAKTPQYIHLFQKYGGVRGAAFLYLISKGKKVELGQALTEYGNDLKLDNVEPKYVAHYIIKNYPFKS